jgi:glc operon protein GlcG
MYISEKISDQEAMKMINLIIEESNKLKKPIAAAVCGPEGELIAFIRKDGLNAASSVIAQNKAYTAAREQTETFKIGKRIRDENISITFWGDSKITGFGGGIPICKDEKFIGSIGVSGLSEEEDIRIAKKAISTIL